MSLMICRRGLGWGLGLCVWLLPALAIADEPKLDHVGAFNFTVEIEGVNAGYFKGVDGLNAEVELVQHDEGDYVFLRQRAAKAGYGNITLKRGYTATDDLFEWWKTQRGLARTVTLSLVQFPTRKGKRIAGASQKKLCSYTLTGAKLTSLQSTKTKDGQREAIATLVAHEVTHTCQNITLKPGEQPKLRAPTRR